MANPIISWMNETNDAVVSDWNLGIINAGEPSLTKRILLWNNRGLATDVSDMNDCAITTKASDGTNTTPPIIGRWVEVNVVSMAEPEGNFTPIGGAVIKEIKASGQAAGTIKGTANDGVKANSAPNFAEFTLRANPPLNSPAGTFSFLVRASYTFV